MKRTLPTYDKISVVEMNLFCLHLRRGVNYFVVTSLKQLQFEG